MKNNTTRFCMTVCLFCLAVTFVLTGCNSYHPRYIHSPSVHNAAFLRQRGDFKISVAGAGNPGKILSKVRIEDSTESVEHAAGFDGQVAVAVTNHFMLTASGNYRSDRDHFDNDDLGSQLKTITDIKYKRSNFDLGAGFFTPMGNSNKIYFAGVVGMGLGKMYSTDVVYPYEADRYRYYEANTLKYFFHPSFNFFFNEYLRMSVAPRLSLLRFYNIRTNYTDGEETSLEYNVTRTKTFGLFEPSVVLQTGFKNVDWLKLDLGFNFSSAPSTREKSEEGGWPALETYNVRSRNFLLSLGISVYPGRGK